MKLNKRKISLSLTSVLLSGFIITGSSNKADTVNEKEEIKAFAEYKGIAHALGGYNGYTYTNSVEGFKENYDKGTRLFEVDLIETTEGELVARHDWGMWVYEKLEQEDKYKNNESISLEEFKNLKSGIGVTSATFEDVLKLMQEYDDFYIVTDTKTAKQEDAIRIFSKLVEDVKAFDENLLDRIVPQIYNREMLKTIREVYNFKDILYTLYLEWVPDWEVVNFVKENDITGIVMATERCTEDFVNKLKEAGVKVYVHTINDLDEANKYLSMGVDGVYTDFLMLED